MTSALDPQHGADLESQIRRCWEAKDFHSATTTAMRGYGPQIFGFLVALHRDPQAAGDVFSMFAESVWRGLPAFTWQSSFRTWAYTVARNASFHHRKSARREARRFGEIGEAGELSAIAEQVRTATLTYLRSETKSKLVALRDALPEEDRALLILRVDRKLAWNDLARVLSGSEEELGEGGIKREAARLRKRFQLVKEKLLEAAREQGLQGENHGE